MRLARCGSAALLLSLCCSSSQAADKEQKPAEQKPLHVKVRAVDASGTPMTGALIATWQCGEGRDWWEVKPIAANGGKELRTGRDGRAALLFTLPPNPANYHGPRTAFCLTAQAEGYLVARSGRIDPAPGDHFEVAFTLRRLLSVAGRVIDQQGRPIAGATVFHTGNATLRTEVKTDGQGRFRLDGLPEEKSPLFVTHPGYHFHGQLVDTAAKWQELKLLAADQTPAPLRTLPPLRSREEELKVARRVILPLWQAAMKSAAEGAKESYAECCAEFDPWGTYDYVNAHFSKQVKNSFVTRELPLLYAADPEEALALLESLDTWEYMKAYALLGTIRDAPGLSRRQKLDLLDRAAQHAKAATADPEERVYRLSSVALWLFKLGKEEEARKTVAIVTPLAKQFSPKAHAALCTAAGEAISLFDLPAGVRLVQRAESEGDDCYWLPAVFHIAGRIAAGQPAEAERMVAEALDADRVGGIKRYRADHQRDPRDEDLARIIGWSEMRLPSVCYRMASADADRAERMARRVHNPRLRAYALGLIAKALTPRDKPRARRLIVQAYDILTEDCRNHPRCLALDAGVAATVAAALLPVVEEIDPTLVGPCTWRAVSYRLHRSADQFLATLDPEYNDAALAVFVARYDRGLAAALVPSVDAIVTPGQDSAAFYRILPLTFVDLDKALEELRSDWLAHDGETPLRIVGLLSIESPRRWDAYAMNYCWLWNPDNEYYFAGCLSW
jgi:hypothetical protein